MKWAGILAGFLFLLLVSTSAHRPQAETAFQTNAVWVTRWACKSPGDVKGLFKDLKTLGTNTVFFQVRGSCDALYKSSYEPWSAVLTGSLGVDPGWDPLEVAIGVAHELDMDIHAWINVFPAWQVSDSGEPPPKSEPLHVMLAHPGWVARDASGAAMPLVRSQAKHNYAFLSPTHRGAQQHIRMVVEELVERYEIDGLHLDYVRFPDSSYSYDSETKASYIRSVRQATLSFADWRRLNLTEYVGELARTAKAIRPQIEISAAVWQKIGAGKDYYFQDGVEWIRRGYVDFVVPMIYTTSVEAFQKRLAAYCDLAGAGNVVAGIGPYLDAFTDSILVHELEVAQKHGVRGISIFNSDYAVAYASQIRGWPSHRQEQD